jgi:hypothetical protein
MTCNWCRSGPGQQLDYLVMLAPTLILSYLAVIAVSGLLLTGGRKHWRTWTTGLLLGGAVIEIWMRVTWEGPRGGGTMVMVRLSCPSRINHARVRSKEIGKRAGRSRRRRGLRGLEAEADAPLFARTGQLSTPCHAQLPLRLRHPHFISPSSSRHSSEHLRRDPRLTRPRLDLATDRVPSSSPPRDFDPTNGNPPQP